MVTLRLLGGLSLAGEHGPLAGRAAQKKRLALLAILSIVPTGRVSRDRLLALLWPEHDREHSRHQLAASVYELRRALGHGALRSVGDDLAIDRSEIVSDAGAFEEAHRNGDPERAVGLYLGPFLDGFFVERAPEFERWCETQRERLGRQYARALETLAMAAVRGGDLEGSVEWWWRLADHDPYSARATVGLMEALDASGRRAEALRRARTYEALLQAELGVAAEPEVRALTQRLRGDAPACRSLPGAALAG
jgi:DNA-binding SARP family transcriptional activator